MKFTSSSNFDYSDIDFVLSCDGSYDSISNVGSIGWTISTRPAESLICSHRSKVQSKSSLETERKSIKSSLKEAKRMSSCSNVIVRCDVDIVVEEINKKSQTDIEDLLDSFNMWGVRSVNRDKIERPHMLAISVLNNTSDAI